MYRVDVYKYIVTDGKTTKKKISSHWYPTEEQAKKVSDLLYRMPKGTYCFVPREGKQPITCELGGYTTSKPIYDETVK